LSVTGDQSDVDQPDSATGQELDVAAGEAPDLATGQEPDVAAGEAADVAAGEAPDAAAGDEAAHDQTISDDEMSTRDVRHRAVTGAVVDALRAIGVRVASVVGTIVTARLLTPYDFGLVAIGVTVLAFGDFLSDGGVGVTLIRRPEPPTRAELKALTAFQLGLDILIVIVVGLVMLPFGMVGKVTTVIIASLPFGAFRAPAYILYERRLNYRPMAMVEVVQTTVYYVWAIGTIILGWGVWALATAYIVRSAVAVVLIYFLLPEARLVPVPSFKKIRPLLGFGIRYQAVGLAHMARDQGVNIALATFGGVAVLGLWNVAWGIIQIPVSLLAALWRVSFPGMSKLVTAKEDVGGTIERVIGLVAIGTGVLVVPLAASASPWIHVLIGDQWADAASAIPPACFAMMFGVPISVALAGYLWAIGSASVPLRSTLIGIPATWVLLLALMPFIGVTAAGISYIASALVESVFFVYAARQTTSFKLGSRLAAPMVISTAAFACGWLAARWIGPDLAGALVSSAVALVAFVGGLAAVHRADLTDAWTLVARGLRGVLAKSVDARSQPRAEAATG
jgi:polysaccharide transporter, PST family